MIQNENDDWSITIPHRFFFYGVIWLKTFAFIIFGRVSVYHKCRFGANTKKPIHPALNERW